MRALTYNAMSPQRGTNVEEDLIADVNIADECNRGKVPPK
jgi:hypothetical protein